MSLFVEERTGGEFAFFMEGDLQFDSQDEAIYHESLALPALCLSRLADGEGRRVLICGGGDGLALRECLRFPNTTHVDLVDIDDSVVNLGKTRFASQNAHAFEDPRVTVHIADAWDFLEDPDLYDVILCDFTVPRRAEETRIFSQEWYQRLKRALTPDGVLALNAVSPERTPEAFWCLRKTVRSAGLFAVPYRACIPSFRAQGYGVWGFILASARPLSAASLSRLHCPIVTRQIDLGLLGKGASFRRAERNLEASLPIHTLANPCLLPFLLNPGLSPSEAVSQSLSGEEPLSLDPLIRAIPIQHAYHTREMIELMAQEVIGSVRALDIPRLIEELLARAERLPRALVEELQRLREYVHARMTLLEGFSRWCYRLFALLVILMTVANVIAPDNAFGKGSFGIGRVSMSRGYTAGYRARSSVGSFSGNRGFNVSAGRGAVGGSFSAPPAPVARINGSGFRRSYGAGVPTDVYGNSYRVRVFHYYDNADLYFSVRPGYSGGGVRPAPAGNRAQPVAKDQKALFVADEDMMVLENGDIVITLSEDAYLLVRSGAVFLMSHKEPTPLLPMFSDPELFESIVAQLRDQQVSLAAEIRSREEWLAWAGWSASLFPSLQADKKEMQNLRDLSRRIDKAIAGLGKPAKPAPVTLEPGSVELFAGCYVTADGKVSFRRRDGAWQRLEDGKWGIDKGAEPFVEAPPALKPLLRSVIDKLLKEFAADIAANNAYINELKTERVSLDKDFQDYTRLANSYGLNYSVDYGTDEMSASEALRRTEADMAFGKTEFDKTILENEKLAKEIETLKGLRL